MKNRKNRAHPREVVLSPPRAPCIAFIPAKGMGDALLFSILAHNAHLSGCRITIFHRFHAQLTPFLNPEFTILPEIPEKELGDTLAKFNTTFFQNDHSSLAYELHTLRKNESADIRFILPKPSPLYKKQDSQLDPQLTMVKNLQLLSGIFFGKSELTNGSRFFSTWKGADSKTIFIHPFSGNTLKNWPLSRFIETAKRLEKKGFIPHFICTPEEVDKLSVSYEKTVCASLEQLGELFQNGGAFVGNDSGPGHVASLIGLPTLTIGGNTPLLRLWRPGWTVGEVCSPTLPLPNFKGIGLALRDRHWQFFVSPSAVMRHLLKIL